MKERAPISPRVLGSYDIALNAAFASNVAYDAFENLQAEKRTAEELRTIESQKVIVGDDYLQELDCRIKLAKEELSDLIDMAGVKTTKTNPNNFDCIKSPRELEFVSLGKTKDGDQVAFIDQHNLDELIDYLYQGVSQPRFTSKVKRVIYSDLTSSRRFWESSRFSDHTFLPIDYFYRAEDRPDSGFAVDGLLVSHIQDIANSAKEYPYRLHGWGEATLSVLQGVADYVHENADRLSELKRLARAECE